MRIVIEVLEVVNRMDGLPVRKILAPMIAKMSIGLLERERERRVN